MTQTVTSALSSVVDHAETGMTTTSAAPFRLLSGRYMFAASGSFNSEFVSLSRLGPDGSTYIICETISGAAATISAAGSLLVDVPEGQFEFVASGTLTSVNAAVSRLSAR